MSAATVGTAERFEGSPAGCPLLFRGLVSAACGALLVAFAVLAASPAAAAEETVPESQGEIALTFAPLVKKAAPAVVNIFARSMVKERTGSRLFDDPFFRRFFGKDFGLPFGRERERMQNSLGSGVIVDGSGLIVTNNHVIEGADEIRVVLRDRREFAAEVVGVDEDTDLAVLRVDAGGESLPAVEFGDSDALEVGDLVLAIGNPFGVGQTVTLGIVSGLARSNVGVADIGSFIQTDAAVNPGNSGGALIATDGRLVGINTAIFSRSGGSLGIGFAVPANMVQFVLEGMTESGRVVRPWLGAWGQPVTADMASALGLERPRGVLVNGVWPDGAADRAGLDVGDVILSVDGREVNHPRELAYRIGSSRVGGTAELAIRRGEQDLTLDVPLERAPEEPPRDTTLLEGDHPLNGAEVANMSPALAEEVGIDRVKPGVVVLRIARGSPAHRFRVRPGDRVLAVNDARIDSVETLESVTGRPADRWDMTLERDGKRFDLTIER